MKTNGIGLNGLEKKPTGNDPHIEAYDELLDEVSRVTLTFIN